jgi:hypothetical protein
MDMRDLRKVDVKSAVYSFPHSKGEYICRQFAC